MKVLKSTTIILLLLAIICIATACNTVKYQYTQTSAFYQEPTFGTTGLASQALRIKTDKSTINIDTSDTKIADNIVGGHKQLLDFLTSTGVQTKPLTYNVSHYKQSFADNANSIVYLNINSPKDYTTILATLSAMWGEYTNYGYLYAVSNAIAQQLSWTTDSVQKVEQEKLDNFFKNNVDMLDLDYLHISNAYSTTEAINCCKALALRILGNIDWQSNLSQTIDQQLKNFYNAVENYAKQLDIDYTRSTILYAYFGSNIPLKIKTANLEIQLENGHIDSATGNADYWQDNKSIFFTANTIKNEVDSALKKFDLYDTAELVTLKMYSPETAQKMYGRPYYNAFWQNSNTITATTLMGYLHEYYHYIEHTLNPSLGQVWQQQAFCELGRAYSYFSQEIMSSNFEDPDWSDLFVEYFGHQYQNTLDDYFLVYDMYCYLANEYQLDYNTGRNPLNSFSYYLVKQYGETATMDMLLFPEKVTTITTKNWTELYDEWSSHIKEKFDGKQIPDWAL